jgi:replicative DNA helicase
MKFEIASKIQPILNDTSLSPQEVFHRVKKIINDTESQMYQPKESVSIAQLALDNLALMAKSPKNINVVKTEFSGFDHNFSGLGLGELVVIGGRPGMGKTQLVINLALNISTTFPLLYFSLDLSSFALSSRFLASLSSINIQKIIQNKLNDEEKDNLNDAVKKLDDYKIFVNDSSNYSIQALKEHCKKHIEENGVKVIIIDYLQLISPLKYRNNREYEISIITRELKNIAKEFNVCVIVSSQLSRAVESRGGDKRPMLSDLRESGSIENDADMVIFIYRPEYYGIYEDADGNSTLRITELIVAKNRNGEIGTTVIKMDGHRSNFRDFDAYKNEFDFNQSRLDEIEPEF